MLRHVCLTAPRQQLFAAKVIVASNRAAIAEIALRNYSSCGPSSKSSWGQPQRRQQSQWGSARPLRRPATATINGNSIPLHISDLSLTRISNAATTSVVKPAPRQYDSDLVVVLDMDECLIHSQFLSSPLQAQVYAHQLQQKRRANTAADAAVAPPVDNFRFSLPEGELVHVNVRPGLYEFLEKVCAKFETHIFTAAMPVYANPLLNHLDPTDTLFAGRWFRDSCAFDAKRGAYVKELRNLPVKDNMDRVVLVDNNPLSFLTQPNNGILVSSFYNDGNDDSLTNVWQMLEELDQEKDVRPVLRRAFGLETALQQMQNGPPAPNAVSHV